ncbi:MAG: hypothetical protein ACM3X0_17390 [Bacteroidota bacterium]
MPYTNQTFEQKLALLAYRGLANADVPALREIADCLWHSRYVPDLGLVPSELRQDAGYVVDRLTRFNVLDQAREIEILAALAPWQDKVDRDAVPGCRDPLAQEWGAHADLSRWQLMALHYPEARKRI